MICVYFEGGSVGLVTVDWSFVGGTALRNSDFNGDDATLKFAHGETTKGRKEFFFTLLLIHVN